MINTALKLINEFIIQQRLQTMKRWSRRSRKAMRQQRFKNMLTIIRNLLNLISGNEIINMLKSDSKVNKISC